MSNRLTFSLASFIPLIALVIAIGFIATPAMAAEFADNANIADVSVVQGAVIDITFPTATSTEPAGADPATDPAGKMSATLTPEGGSAVNPSAADPPVAETSGTFQGLVFTFDAATGVGKLKGNASPALVGRILVTYTIAETDGGDTGTDPADPASLTFTFEVTAQTDLLEFPADAAIGDKELTTGSYFHEMLPAAQGGIGPWTYAITGVITETPADSGIFTGGDLPAGLTFVPATRVLSGTPTAADPRAVLTYTVTDSTATPVTKTISFTIEVKARVNGPAFAITKVPDKAYTEGRAIEMYTLPAADTTNALGSVTYKLEGLPTGTGLSFDAATRMLTGTPSDKDQAASPIAATYTATDTASNMKSLPFKITVNDAVAVTITNPNPDTYMRGASGFQTITVAAANGTGKKTLAVTGLPAGLMFDAAKGEITGTPTMAAATEITATATDTLGAMGSKKATITVAAATPLVFESVVAPQSYEVGTPITPMLLPKGSGGIGTLTYALTGLPAGITFDATTRLLRGTPTTATPAADYNYIISDSAFSHVTSPSADQVPNTVTLPISITVMAPPETVNSAPDFGDATIANIVATVNTAIPGMFLPEATDADASDTLTYSVTPALPAGITFTATNRALTGTPTAMMSETAYTYMVDDGNGGTDTIGFFITVNAAQTPPVNAPPAFASDAMVNNITATAGMEIEGRFLPEATDPEGDLVSYWITPALPTGLAFNRTTRALTGTPTAMMSQTAYTYNAADASNLLSPATLPFFITVNEAPNVAPVYADTTPVAIMGTVGVAIDPVSVAATDANGDTLTYSWDVDETALGLMLNTATGVISGTPLKAHTGTHPVTATDPDGLTAMRSVTVTVSAAPPTNVAPVVTITTTAPTAAQTGSFAIAYTATDANAGDTVTATATHTMSPASATGYTVAHDAATKMVTITQAAGSPIAVITVTITAMDTAGLSDSESISVTFAASAPTPVDTTPPTVTVMAPIAPDADGNLVFKFVFSEPIQASSFTAMDIAGEDYIVTAGPTMDATDTTMKTWTAKVKATGDDDVTVVINVGAVMDMAGNANVVGAFAGYTPPTAPAAPVVTATPAVGSVTFTWTVVSGATYEYNTDGTTWMDATAGSVTVSGSTAITFNVRVKAASGVPAGMTATVTATPTAPSGPAPVSLAAKGYLVIVGAGFDANTLPGVTPTEVAGFPADLAAFLIAGGTVDVAATGGDVIINELMVTRDAYKIGNGDPTDGQWIELYNQGTTAATGVSVTFSSARPAPAAPANHQDRLSNVVGQGWNFEGTFGADVITGSSNPDAMVNFVSIRRSQPGKNGWTAGHWQKTPTSLVFAQGRVGTPGKVNAPTVFTPVPNDKPALGDVIISEVANRTDDSKEWIELKGPAGKSLKNWKLSIATAVGTETVIFNFPGNDNIRISPNGYLLLTDVNPLNSELAADYANGVPTPNRYKNAIVTLGALPNDGNFVLILRSDKGKTNHEAIQDIAGYAGAALQRANPYATLWPLRGNAGVISSHNKLAGGKVYRRVRANIHGYSATAGNKLHESAFGAVGFTGIGYDRNAPVTAENGGTPGYPHGAFKGDGADAPGNVIISEIMYATQNGVRGNRNLPQWIEIHNTSDTNGVNLHNWRLDIVNSGKNKDGSEYTGKFSENISLSGTIPPNQTYLIVARLGVSQNTRLPSQRIRNAAKKFNEQLVNPNGFHLTLKAKTHKGANEHVIVDTVGNLNDPPTTRRAEARSFAGNAWELENAIAEDGSRISISRRTSPKLNAKGTDQAGWILTDIDPRYGGIIQLTHYGRSDDRSTPGYTIGGALPVSLSKFRPERLATGEVVVRWVTESETNNAGFNILRSDAKDGQFTKLNTKLIAGQGTTSERTTYEFTDTSAKPNVFYYYQIQDVSFDGEVATLRTTHVRGNVTPAGKITTTWGELKALQ